MISYTVCIQLGDGKGKVIILPGKCSCNVSSAWWGTIVVFVKKKNTHCGSTHFVWSSLCQALLLCWPVSAVSQLDQPLELQVDAHGVGVGVVLFQKETHAWIGQ